MKNAVIYVFSGTGNTRRICGLYRDEFEKQGVKTNIFNLEKGFIDLPDASSYDYVGFAYPVHGFNAPEIMLELARFLPDAEGKKYFILSTSGEPLALNNISSLKFDSLMRKSGYELTNEYRYTMPYNMIFRHSDEIAAKMWSTATALAPLDAREILCGKRRYLKKIPFGKAVAALFRVEHPAMAFNGKRFKADYDKCIGCGLCVKTCPAHNIRMNPEGKLSFGGDCIGCVRCSFNCPKEAISIGFLNGWRVNGQYSFGRKTDRITDAAAKQSAVIGSRVGLNEYPQGTANSRGSVLAEGIEQTRSTLRISADGKHKRYCKRAYERYFREAEERISESAIRSETGKNYDELILDIERLSV